MATITKPLIVYIPDTRGVLVSRYGLGNLKIGPGVYTYSRLPGSPKRQALGAGYKDEFVAALDKMQGTCPGSSEECEKICYASRPVAEGGAVMQMWRGNSMTSEVPPIPDDAKLIRLHISGDFDTYDYIVNWIARMVGRPDVTMWVYTRSWRVPQLLPALEQLRALSNVQMFASMDVSVPEMPPEGWRRAWIDGDPRAGEVLNIPAHSVNALERPTTLRKDGDAWIPLRPWELIRATDGTKALICPEETKAVKNCEECGYCFDGKRNDVVFLKH